ncbi:MAG: SprT-like domain-containing protein, partial [Ginsengibacter sp.]
AQLLQSLRNPAASSCAEDSLLRVLRKYDDHKPGFYFIEQLPVNSLFKEKNGRIFCKGNKVRKRFVCKEIATGKLFLFSPVAEVQLVNQVS